MVGLDHLQGVGDAQITWESKFLPVITQNGQTGPVVRLPEWYALRYISGKEKPIFSILDHIGLEYHWLSFTHKIKRRSKPIRRSWLPGVLFCHFDRRYDRWQQINRMPNVISFYGSPTAIHPAVFDDLIRRCPERPERPTQFSCVAPGTLVRIIRGPRQGEKAVVLSSDRKWVKLPMLMFGRADVEVTVKAADVEIVE